ncbi:MAG: glycosyltransferase family 2 protein [Myxococcaceae bacterium]
MNPDVSIITPTFRREREVVEAVRGALAQEGVQVEVIVLDDTPEGTARARVAAIGDARVRYVKRAVPSRGRPALVRNEGLALARGRYIYCLDDDDQVLPGALQAMVCALDARPDAGVAFGTVRCHGNNEEVLQRYQAWVCWAAEVAKRVSHSSWLTAGIILFRGTVLINSACMMRRECAIALGGYDASIPLYEDVDFFMRGIREFGHVFVDHPVLHYRTGEPSLIHDLGGDETPIADSYRMIHRKYKGRHGGAEYRTLQLVAKLWPVPMFPRTEGAGFSGRSRLAQPLTVPASP